MAESAGVTIEVVIRRRDVTGRVIETTAMPFEEFVGLIEEQQGRRQRASDEVRAAAMREPLEADSPGP